MANANGSSGSTGPITEVNPVSREFSGHTITLTDDLRFEVTGPEFAEDAQKTRHRLFDSFVDARAAITQRLAESDRLAAKNVRLNIRVIDDYTHEIVIVEKISRSTGRLIGVADQCRDVYPAVRWIIDALERRDELRKDIAAIDAALKEIVMSATRYHGGRMDVDQYPRYVATLVKEFEENMAIAKAKAPLIATAATVPTPATESKEAE